jgi:large subunit ribosomal protein L21
MWAVAEINSKQYLVKKQDTIRVERLSAQKGEVLFDKVLLLADDKKIDVGTPYLKNVKIKAEVISEGKGDKAISYKYRRRKKSRRIRGHRQIYTLLKILDILPS